MYKSEFIQAAAEQLAKDYGCTSRDFFSDENTVVENIPRKGSRDIFDNAPFMRIAVMGKGAVISADKRIIPFLSEIAEKYTGEEFFTGKVRFLLGSELAKYGKAVGDSTIYYLPETPYKYNADSGARLRVYEENAVKTELYKHKEFPNALLYKDHGTRRDVLAVCAVNAEKIAAMAGASSDSKQFWQIGIDTKKEFRGLGLGSRCVKALTYEIMAHGAIPYYGTWSGNIASQKLALSAGFHPVWAEIFSQDI